MENEIKAFMVMDTELIFCKFDEIPSTFAVKLDAQPAAEMLADGWRVMYKIDVTNPEGAPQAYIHVRVNSRHFDDPEIWVRNSQGDILDPETALTVLQNPKGYSASVVVQGREWVISTTIDGIPKHGITACLKVLRATLNSENGSN